jgi:hypothetical protein
MAKSRVTFSVEAMDLGQISRSIDFVIFDDDQKLGSLRVSRGAVYWTPANGELAKRMSWKQFAGRMSDGTRNVRPKKR